MWLNSTVPSQFSLCCDLCLCTAVSSLKFVGPCPEVLPLGWDWSWRLCLLDWICALEEDSENWLPSFPLCSSAMWRLRRRLLPGTGCWCLDLVLHSLQNIEKIDRVAYKSPSLWYFDSSTMRWDAVSTHLLGHVDVSFLKYQPSWHQDSISSWFSSTLLAAASQNIFQTFTQIFRLWLLVSQGPILDLINVFISECTCFIISSCLMVLIYSYWPQAR